MTVQETVTPEGVEPTSETKRLTAEQQELVEQHEGLILWSLRKWPHLVDMIGEDEAKSLGAYAMCVAARRYDPARSKFVSWATRYIWGYWMQEARMKLVPDGSKRRYLALDQGHAEGLPSRDSEPEFLRSDEDESERLRRLVALLPRRQRHAVRRVVIDGVLLRVAAREAGVSKEAVRQAKEAGLKNLRKWLTREEESCPAS